MDLEMPVLDGYAATQEIRKNPKYNNIPILALSANVTKDAIDKAFVSGMQGYISKPIVIDIFYKKIYDALANEMKLAPNMRTQKDELRTPELSAVVGMGRCNNDKELYAAILKDFQTIYASSTKTLETLCKKEDFKEVKKITVDIKDVALNIGAYHLYEIADTLEHEIEYGKHGNWEETLMEYEETLSRLLEEIQSYLEEK
jgi:CheY-like chemotaxis protein